MYSGFEPGGIQNVILNITKYLKNDFVFDAIVFNKNEQLYDNEFKKLGGMIYSIPHYDGKINFFRRLDFYIRYIRIYLNVRKIIKNNGPYIAVHCNNSFESGIIVKVAKKLNIPNRIVHVHTSGYVGPKSNCVRQLYEKYYKILIEKYATKKIACSRNAGEFLYLDMNQNFEVIPNGVDLEKFNHFCYKKKKSCEIRLIQIGQYCINKNQEFSIDLLYMLLNEGYNVSLKLIGFGEYINNLKKQISRLKISHDRIEFFPSNYSIPDALSDSDVLLLPSLSEGFAIVAIEAQAMGVPCIISEHLPRDADAGGCYFLSLNDQRKWINQIIYLKNSKPKIDISKFDMKKISLRYKNLYKYGSGD